MRRKSESRMGILFIQNIHSKITPVKIKNFLRKFGKINRTFFLILKIQNIYHQKSYQLIWLV